LAMAAEITLAVSMPWAIRPPKGVAAANSSLTCIALLSPDTPANNTRSASVIVLGEQCAHADAKVLYVVAIELVHDAVPKPTASLPFSPSIARASAGLATSRDSSSRIRLILRTCSALDLAIWPLPR